jgi:hypothetical protein
LKSYLFVLLTLLSCLALRSYGTGQDDPVPLGGRDDQSLGEVAKHKSASTTHAKRVLTDEDPGVHRQEIPQILFDRVSNSSEIVQAILAFSTKHTPAETESAVKAWYQDELNQIAHARSEITRATSAPKPLAYDNPDDYEKMQRQYREQAEIERQRSATRGLVLHSRNDMIRQIHDGLSSVKSEIAKDGMVYKWFDTNIPYVIYYGPAE